MCFVNIWGDSIMRGLIFDEAKEQYRVFPDGAGAGLAKLGIKVKNRAKVGMTAPEGQKVLIDDLSRGNYDCNIALIEFGGNDSDFHWEEVAKSPHGDHNAKTKMPDFISSMKDMITRLRAKEIKPILMSLPPLDEKRYFEYISEGKDGNNILKWLGSIKSIFFQQESYSDAVVKISKEMDCTMVDVRNAFLGKGNYSDYLCRDGIHPNAKGYLLIQEVFSKNYNQIFS